MKKVSCVLAALATITIATATIIAALAPSSTNMTAGCTAAGMTVMATER